LLERGIVISSTADLSEEGGESMLARYRYIFFLVLSFGLAAVAASLQGKGAATGIFFQSTSDVYNELAPCG